MRVRIARYVQRSDHIVLTDIITERTVYSLLKTEHNSSTAIPVAVIILIERSITRVGVPCLSVAISSARVLRVKALIVLEYGIFALPRPDSGCYPTKVRCIVIRCIYILCRTIGHIVFYNGTVAIHRCDSVSAHILHIVIAYHYIAVPILPHDTIRELISCKPPPVRSICRSYTPAVYILHMAVCDLQVIISRYARLRFICRQSSNKIDTAVQHVFIVYVAIYIMHIQVIQNNMVCRSNILRHSSHTCAVHYIFTIPWLPRIFRMKLPPVSVICNLKTTDLDIFYVF